MTQLLDNVCIATLEPLVRKVNLTGIIILCHLLLTTMMAVLYLTMVQYITSSLI